MEKKQTIKNRYLKHTGLTLELSRVCDRSWQKIENDEMMHESVRTGQREYRIGDI